MRSRDGTDCFCKACSTHEAVCDFLDGLHCHSEQVNTLLKSSSESIVLIVGPSKTRICCHKAILGFYSKFFDAMLFGGFAESAKVEIELPDHEEDLMGAFVNWAYTGNIRTCHPNIRDPYEEADVSTLEEAPERLWVLGDKLLASEFTKDAMELVGRRYHMHPVQATTADYVYDNTLPESNLRLFWKQLVRTEGPLLRNPFDGTGDVDVEWVTILAKGGDLVTDCLAGFSVEEHPGRHEDTPYSGVNLYKYIDTTNPISATDWIKAKQDEKEQSGRLTGSSKRKYEH